MIGVKVDGLDSGGAFEHFLLNFEAEGHEDLYI